MNKAFTLIELLMTVIILAILIGLVTPTIGSTREKARRIICIKQMQDINTVLVAHGFASREVILCPGRIGTQHISVWDIHPDIFWCPSDKEKHETGRYVYLPGTRMQFLTGLRYAPTEREAKKVYHLYDLGFITKTFHDSGPYHSGVLYTRYNSMFWDGSYTEWVDDSIQ